MISAAMSMGGCHSERARFDLTFGTEYPSPGAREDCESIGRTGDWLRRSPEKRDALVVWDVQAAGPRWYCPVFAGTRGAFIDETNDRMAAVGNDGWVRVWRLSDGRLIQTLAEPGPGPHRNVVFAGTRLVAMTGSELGECSAEPTDNLGCRWQCTNAVARPTFRADTVVQRIDGSTFVPLWHDTTFGWTQGLAFDRTGRLLAVAEHLVGSPSDPDNGAFLARIQVVDTDTGATLAWLHHEPSSCVAGESPRMYSEIHFADDATVTGRFWTADGAVGTVSWQLPAGNVVRESVVPTDLSERPMFSEDLRLVALVSDGTTERGSVLRLFDMDRDSEVWRLETRQPMDTFRFSPTGERLLVGVGNSLELRDTTNGRVAARIAIPHDQEFVRSTAFSPGEDRVMIAATAGLFVWHVEETRLEALDDGMLWSCSGTFSTNGRWLAAACHDETAQWQLME